MAWNMKTRVTHSPAKMSHFQSPSWARVTYTNAQSLMRFLLFIFFSFKKPSEANSLHTGREVLLHMNWFGSPAVLHRALRCCCSACVIRARRTGLNNSMLPAAPLSLSPCTDLVYIRSLQVGQGAGDSQPRSLGYQPRSGKKNPPRTRSVSDSLGN